LTACLKRPFRAVETAILALRLLTLSMLLFAFIPVYFLHAQEPAQVAVNAEKIKALETSNTDLIQQNESLQGRVSRIEGIGIGLGALTCVQLFLQLGAHVAVRRKN
jgi:hypothetical protein